MDKNKNDFAFLMILSCGILFYRVVTHTWWWLNYINLGLTVLNIGIAIMLLRREENP